MNSRFLISILGFLVAFALASTGQAQRERRGEERSRKKAPDPVTKVERQLQLTPKEEREMENMAIDFAESRIEAARKEMAKIQRRAERDDEEARKRYNALKGAVDYYANWIKVLDTRREIAEFQAWCAKEKKFGKEYIGKIHEMNAEVKAAKDAMALGYAIYQAETGHKLPAPYSFILAKRAKAIEGRAADKNR